MSGYTTVTHVHGEYTVCKHSYECVCVGGGGGLLHGNGTVYVIHNNFSIKQIYEYIYHIPC